MSEQVLFQFREPASPPSLEDVASRFEFTQEELDHAYGVTKVAEDPAGTLYAVRISAAARDRLGSALLDASDPAVGFFSNPRIETFGPPQP